MSTFYLFSPTTFDLDFKPIEVMKRTVLLAIVALFSFSFFASAQDAPANDNDFSKWKARLRVLAVAPNESATIGVIGGDVEISTAFIPELDFTYYFNKNWAAELILGTAKHDVNTINSDITAVGGGADVEVDLGSVMLLPPTLTLQYHMPMNGFEPYIGAGLNYTFFYSVKSGDVVKDVEYDDALGFAFQAGFDFDLSDKWFLNFDAKYILLNTDVTVDASNLAPGLSIPAEVDINPLLIGIGFGMKF